MALTRNLPDAEDAVSLTANRAPEPCALQGRVYQREVPRARHAP